MSSEIRAASRGDLNALRSLAKHGDVVWADEALRGALERHACIWVYESFGGGLAGVGVGNWAAPGQRESNQPENVRHERALLAFIVVGRAADIAEIQNVVVDPASRRRGLGRQIVEHVIAWAQANRVAELRLEVGSRNTAALDLYLQCGFERCGVRPRYYASGDDAVLMARFMNSMM